MKRSSVLFTELDRRLSLSNNNQNKRKYKEENKKCRKNRQREKQRDFDKVNNKIFLTNNPHSSGDEWKREYTHSDVNHEMHVGLPGWVYSHFIVPRYTVHESGFVFQLYFLLISPNSPL